MSLLFGERCSDSCLRKRDHHAGNAPEASHCTRNRVISTDVQRPSALLWCPPPGNCIASAELTKGRFARLPRYGAQFRNNNPHQPRHTSKCNPCSHTDDTVHTNTGAADGAGEQRRCSC